MPLIEIDLTSVGLIPEGNYVGTVAQVKYQIKTGEKWNQEGTSDTDFESFKSFPATGKRLHYAINIPGKGAIFADFYLMDNALGFIKTFMKACGCEFSKQGFDPECPIGRQVGVNISVSEDPLYGARNVYNFSKV